MGVWQRVTPMLCIVYLILSLTPRQALAASQKDKGCLPRIGTKVPVLFVHGFSSNANMWGDNENTGSMFYQINKLAAVYIDPALGLFSYVDNHTEWVTDDNIGLELAKRIDCMATSSRLEHGRGKVIIVAHSMGGLATRYAASLTIDGRSVADSIGLVITIGTPNKGSSLADWATALSRSICSFDTIQIARQLAEARSDCLAPGAWAMQTLINSRVNSLPWLPPSIPVMAIAGNVLANLPLGILNIPIFGSDLVVSVDSALAGANDGEHGGGTFELQCLGGLPIPDYSGATCEHNALPNSPDVQAMAADSIRRYFAATPLVTAADYPCAFRSVSFEYAAGYLRQDDYQFNLSVRKGPACHGSSAIGVVFYDYVHDERPDQEIILILPRGSDGELTQNQDGIYGGSAESVPPKICQRLTDKLRLVAQSWGACLS